MQVTKKNIRHCLLHWLALVLMSMVASFHVHAQSPIRHSQAVDRGTDRIIIKLKDGYKTEFNQSLSRDRVQSLSAHVNLQLRSVRPMSGNAHVLALPQRMRGENLDKLVEQLRTDPAVEYAFADTREPLQAIPNDPLYGGFQYYLQAASTFPGSSTVSSLNAPTAWDITTGSANVVVGLIDGGVRFDHPDLNGQLLAGYDFVSADCSATLGNPLYAANCTTGNQYTTANDGNARDADSSDPGNGYTASEYTTNPYLNTDPNCDAAGENSDWHGTHVAGIIGARANNGIGVAGLNWSIRMLPVRVSGRCGAYLSDVLDGIRWAAGIDVPGVPTNTTPAKVLNISLGGSGSCSGTGYLQVIADVIARGVIVVASAGNEDSTVGRPANCDGVISVGAVRPDGLRTTYSNSGSNLTIMAPGGDVIGSSSVGFIASTNNAGTAGPVAYTTSGYYAQGAGTSFSTPMVTGTVALMLAINPNLTPQNVKDILMQTARPFISLSAYPNCVPGGGGNLSNILLCNCTTAACGAGYLDSGAAVARVQALLTPAPVAPAAPASSGGGGGGGSLDGFFVLLFSGLAWALACRRKITQR